MLALEDPTLYTYAMPVFKDLGSEGVAGEVLPGPDNEQGDVSLDTVASVGAQAAERFPSFETAGLALSWSGVYDVTPDWNPALGHLSRTRAGGAGPDALHLAGAVCAGALRCWAAAGGTVRGWRGVLMAWRAFVLDTLPDEPRRNDSGRT